MSIIMTQTCEMCGKKRELPLKSDRITPHPDAGGWRQFSNAWDSVTLCVECIDNVIAEAVERDNARMRLE